MLLPEEYTRNEDSIGSRVKGKTEKYTKIYICVDPIVSNTCSSLMARYKKELKRLQQTGGGLGGNDEPIDDFGDQDCNKYLDCYIPNTGPNATTTEEAKNIWGKP